MLLFQLDPMSSYHAPHAASLWNHMTSSISSLATRPYTNSPDNLPPAYSHRHDVTRPWKPASEMISPYSDHKLTHSAFDAYVNSEHNKAFDSISRSLNSSRYDISSKAAVDTGAWMNPYTPQADGMGGNMYAHSDISVLAAQRLASAVI